MATTLFELRIDISEQLDINKRADIIYEERDDALSMLTEIAIAFRNKWKVPGCADKKWRKVDFGTDRICFETDFSLPQEDQRRFSGHIYEITKLEKGDKIVALEGTVFKFMEAEHIMFMTTDVVIDDMPFCGSWFIDMNRREWVEGRPSLPSMSVVLATDEESMQYEMLRRELVTRQ